MTLASRNYTLFSLVETIYALALAQSTSDIAVVLVDPLSSWPRTVAFLQELRTLLPKAAILVHVDELEKPYLPESLSAIPVEVVFKHSWLEAVLK